MSDIPASDLESISPFRPNPEFATFQRFPVECLPAPVREYVLAQAVTLDCDPASVALPALAALSGSIGSRRRMRVSASRTESAVLWTAIVSSHESDHRSAIDVAVAPLQERQSDAFDVYEQKLEEYEQKRADGAFRKRRVKSIGKGKGKDDTPPPPQKPTLEWLVTDERQSKTLIKLLSPRPRGTLTCLHELDGWLGRTPSPGSSRHDEFGRWVSLHEGRELVSKSLSERRGPTRIPNLAVSVTGTIQPLTLLQKFVKSKMTCDLTSRLLFARPTSLPSSLTDNVVDPDVEEGYCAVIDQLLSLKFDCVKLQAEPPEPPPPRLKWEDPVGADGKRVIPDQPRDGKGWFDPAETVARFIMGNWTWMGPGELEDGTIPIHPHSLQAQALPAEPPVPDFDTLVRRLLELSPKSRHRLQGLSFGYGWGRDINEFHLGELIDEMYRYREVHGKADPRNPEQRALDEAKPGELIPALVDMSSEAHRLLVDYSTRTKQQMNEVDETLRPWFGQLASQAARLTLVLHLSRWAAGEEIDPTVCDVTSLFCGIKLAEWFAWETKRIHADFTRSAEQTEQFRLIDWLSRRGGTATVRDLCRSNGRKYPTEAKAQVAMDQLAETGVGVWVDMPPGEKGGPSYRVLSMGVSLFGPKGNEEGGKEEGAEETANHAAEHRATLGVVQPSESSKEVRPKGKRWTIEELVADDPRERLDVGPGSGKPREASELPREPDQGETLDKRRKGKK